MKKISTSDMRGEEQFEAEAAFGENADIIRLEKEDLKEVEEEDEVEFEVNEGDVVTVRFQTGTKYTGKVIEADEFTFRTKSSSDGLKVFSYKDFKDQVEMINIDRA